MSRSPYEESQVVKDASASLDKSFREHFEFLAMERRMKQIHQELMDAEKARDLLEWSKEECEN